MFSYLPHTKRDIEEMLSSIGVSSIEDLFSDIPAKIRLKNKLAIADGLSEYEVFKKLTDLAQKNEVQCTSFLGGGSYDHLIPAAVKHLISRSEFYTAYTPYQAELSQGILQAIFEFQSLICELTSLDAANASLYDGHTAAAEAAVIALNSVKKRNTILYSECLHPFTKEVLHTHFSAMGVTLAEIKEEQGVTSCTDLEAKLSGDVAAVITQSPNFFGYLEDYSAFAELIHENRSLFIISSNPLSLPLLKSQGEWGADIAIGDTQPLGLDSYFGGPSAGYLATSAKYLRKIPGRIVGQSLDRNGRRAFLLTLQAREQHIKRQRADSNICSNQALAALAVTVHAALLGKEGLTEVSRQCAAKAHYLYERLINELPVESLYNQPFFNEFPLKLNKKAAGVLVEMKKKGFEAGLALAPFYGDEWERVITIAVTEKRSRQELDNYTESLKEILL